MRKSREEAAQTRKRIVAAASREFRENGIVATGINDLMKAAGLTHGGFYKHFESKEQLVAEAVEEAVRTLVESLTNATAAGRSVEEVYLSTGQRDNPGVGCPLSANGSELGRSDEKTRLAATAGFLKLVDIVAARLGDAGSADARREALVSVSTMIGAMTMSRVVTDRELSAEILREAKECLSRR